MRQLFLITLLLAVGCTGDYANMNRNPNQVTEEQMDKMNYRSGTQVLALQGQVIPVAEHLYQFTESLSGGPFAGYIGSTLVWGEGSFEKFHPQAHWRKATFSDVITAVYTPYREIVNGTDDEVANAFARLFRVAVMHRLTDNYGPIPYSDIESNESIFVKYDTQEQVYTQMFEQLDAAIEALRGNTHLSANAWGRYDRVYGGNISQWLKYANSLKLRMAMRLSYAAPAIAQAKAAEAIAAGVITDNADNAQMKAVENRTALIYNDWGDSRVGADIITYMNGYNDPRREKMFTKGDSGEFAGIRIGIDPASKADAMKAYSNMIVTNASPYLWMNAAEVTFLRAEYELRWGSTATAGQLYNEAIALSFAEKGAAGAAEYAADSELKPAVYVDPLGWHSATSRQSDITIAWEDDTVEDADKAAIAERNLERLITQKWIAIFPLGVEAWSEHRRTGYPRLLPAVVDRSGGTVDVAEGACRLTYPVEEYTQNSDNVSAAVGLLDGETTGNRKGDTMGTRVWWDCK